MKKYRVKLIYKYVDYVEVEAESEEEAKNYAPSLSEDAHYESLYDTEVIGELHEVSDARS